MTWIFRHKILRFFVLAFALFTSGCGSSKVPKPETISGTKGELLVEAFIRMMSRKGSCYEERVQFLRDNKTGLVDFFDAIFNSSKSQPITLNFKFNPEDLNENSINKSIQTFTKILSQITQNPALIENTVALLNSITSQEKHALFKLISRVLEKINQDKKGFSRMLATCLNENCLNAKIPSSLKSLIQENISKEEAKILKGKIFTYFETSFETMYKIKQKLPKNSEKISPEQIYKTLDFLLPFLQQIFSTQAISLYNSTQQGWVLLQLLNMPNEYGSCIFDSKFELTTPKMITFMNKILRFISKNRKRALLLVRAIKAMNVSKTER